jgi:hypothetical protein
MKLPSYVVEIIGGSIVIYVADTKIRSIVRELGGKRMLFPLKNWCISYETNEALAKMLTVLQENGVPFGSGKQWPPCDVFEELKMKNLVSGSYKKIFWHNQNHYEVVEKQ